jgi:hypothetical protein
VDGVTERARATAAKAAQFVVEPAEPPPRDAHLDRALYGFVQPFVGARLLWRDPALRRAALEPAAWLAGFCALIALTAVAHGPLAMVRRFYTTFAVLAPLRSVLLAPAYARLAARARAAFGFAPCEPCLEPPGRAIARALAQAIVIAVMIAPVSLPLRLVPLVGVWFARAVLALWALHWIVVDAFDAARVLRPGETLADLDVAMERAPSPWYVRALDAGASWIAPLRGLARFGDALSKPWREELAVLERHPSLAAGFALATAALLATPVLNLLFRPIVIAGAAHALGHLERSSS